MLRSLGPVALLLALASARQPWPAALGKSSAASGPLTSTPQPLTSAPEPQPVSQGTRESDQFYAQASSAFPQHRPSPCQTARAWCRVRMLLNWPQHLLEAIARRRVRRHRREPSQRGGALPHV